MLRPSTIWLFFFRLYADDTWSRHSDTPKRGIDIMFFWQRESLFPRNVNKKTLRAAQTLPRLACLGLFFCLLFECSFYELLVFEREEKLFYDFDKWRN